MKRVCLTFIKICLSLSYLACSVVLAGSYSRSDVDDSLQHQIDAILDSKDYRTIDTEEFPDLRLTEKRLASLLGYLEQGEKHKKDFVLALIDDNQVNAYVTVLDGQSSELISEEVWEMDDDLYRVRGDEDIDKIIESFQKPQKKQMFLLALSAGLIKYAPSIDFLAAVLSHEYEHTNSVLNAAAKHSKFTLLLDRSAESEVDARAVVRMDKAGFNPNAYRDFLIWLGNYKGSHAFSLTHTTAASRLDAVNSAISALNRSGETRNKDSITKFRKGLESMQATLLSADFMEYQKSTIKSFGEKLAVSVYQNFFLAFNGSEEEGFASFWKEQLVKYQSRIKNVETEEQAKSQIDALKIKILSSLLDHYLQDNEVRNWLDLVQKHFVRIKALLTEADRFPVLSDKSKALRTSVDFELQKVWPELKMKIKGISLYRVFERFSRASFGRILDNMSSEDRKELLSLLGQVNFSGMPSEGLLDLEIQKKLEILERFEGNERVAILISLIEHFNPTAHLTMEGIEVDLKHLAKLTHALSNALDKNEVLPIETARRAMDTVGRLIVLKDKLVSAKDVATDVDSLLVVAKAFAKSLEQHPPVEFPEDRKRFETLFNALSTPLIKHGGMSSAWVSAYWMARFPVLRQLFEVVSGQKISGKNAVRLLFHEFQEMQSKHPGHILKLRKVGFTPLPIADLANLAHPKKGFLPAVEQLTKDYGPLMSPHLVNWKLGEIDTWDANEAVKLALASGVMKSIPHFSLSHTRRILLNFEIERLKSLAATSASAFDVIEEGVDRIAKLADQSLEVRDFLNTLKALLNEKFNLTPVVYTTLFLKAYSDAIEAGNVNASRVLLRHFIENVHATRSELKTKVLSSAFNVLNRRFVKLKETAEKHDRTQKDRDRENQDPNIAEEDSRKKIAKSLMINTARGLQFEYPEIDDIFEELMSRSLTDADLAKKLLNSSYVRLLNKKKNRVDLAKRILMQKYPDKDTANIDELVSSIRRIFPNIGADRTEVVNHFEQLWQTSEGDTELLDELKLSTENVHSIHGALVIDSIDLASAKMNPFERWAVIRFYLGLTKKIPKALVNTVVQFNHGQSIDDSENYAVNQIETSKRIYLESHELQRNYFLQQLMGFEHEGVMEHKGTLSAILDQVLGPSFKETPLRILLLGYLHHAPPAHRKVIFAQILLSMQNADRAHASMSEIFNAMGAYGHKAAQTFRVSGLGGPELQAELNHFFDRAFEPSRASQFRRIKTLAPQLHAKLTMGPLLGAGSINYVVGAYLDGNPVAIRLQRENVEQQIQNEDEIWSNTIAELRQDQQNTATRHLGKVLAEVRANIMSTLGEDGAEYDQSIERANFEAFQEVYVGQGRASGFKIRPVEPLWDYQNLVPAWHQSRISVYEWIDGTSIDNLDSILQPLVASDIIDVEFDALFVKGVFDRDPHKGNWLIDPAKRELLRIDYAQRCKLSDSESAAFKRVISTVVSPNFSFGAVTVLAQNLEAILDMNQVPKNWKGLLEKIVNSPEFPSAGEPQGRLFFIRERLEQSDSSGEFHVRFKPNIMNAIGHLSRLTVFREIVGNEHFADKLFKHFPYIDQLRLKAAYLKEKLTGRGVKRVDTVASMPSLSVDVSSPKSILISGIRDGQVEAYRMLVAEPKWLLDFGVVRTLLKAVLGHSILARNFIQDHALLELSPDEKAQVYREAFSAEYPERRILGRKYCGSVLNRIAISHVVGQ